MSQQSRAVAAFLIALACWTEPARAADLREPFDPFLHVDWTLGIGGTYRRDADGESFETVIHPEIAFSHEGRRSSIELGAEAELAKLSAEEAVLRALRFSFGTGYAFERVSRLMVNGDLALTQQSRSDPDLADDVAYPPAVLSGGIQAEWTRQFGRFSVAVRSAVYRDVHGPTTPVSGPLIDNQSRNVLGFGAGGRLAYAVTPIVSLFVDAGSERQQFDAPYSGLGVKLDGSSHSLRAGVSGNWHEIWTAEASIGIGLREFDEESLSPIRATLYDASLAFTPDETFSLRGALSTAIAPPGSDVSSSAEIEYRASIETEYMINSWLSLRGRGEWFVAEAEGNDGLRTGFGAGMGADYRLNRHTEISADYAFVRREKASAPAEDAHALTLGFSFSR